MRIPRIKTSIGAIVLCCALAGGAAMLLEGTASAKRVSARGADHMPSDHGPWLWKLAAGPPLHAVSVVPNQAGSGFVTLTVDEGEVASVGVGTITLREGTKQLTYATPSLTIPPSSTITLDGRDVSLEKLATGDSTFVSTSSEGTTVSAWNGSYASGAWPADAGAAHTRSGQGQGTLRPGHSWSAPGDGPPGAPDEGPGAW